MSYQPVIVKQNDLIRVKALVGMHTVILGFNFIGSAAARKKFLGFAVRRAKVDEKEAWWLTGQLRFRDDTADLGEDVPSWRAPFQRFRWGDYAAKPGGTYRYEVFPLMARAKKPGDLKDPLPLTVTTDTGEGASVGLHFNRGVTAALAYRQRFGDTPPDKVPDDAAYHWLSRGLEEALLAFIAAARAGETLKVAIYEFEHAAIIAALKDAAKRKVNVQVVYHAQPGDKQTGENKKHIQELGLPARQTRPRTHVPSISHNKFIVHCRGAKPVRVWTGSTNFTESGLFLQTNVGIVLTEPVVAGAFDRYFGLLWQDLDDAPMKTQVGALRQTIAGQMPKQRQLFFSPVASLELLDVANNMIHKAGGSLFVSCPFGLDASLMESLNHNDARIIEYGLVNTSNRKRLAAGLTFNTNTWMTAPAALPVYLKREWDAKAYGQHKIHVKALVTDPWSADPKNPPRVLIGSANFSDESCRKNDENALFIEGDRRLAAVVATEFLRVFEHYKFRDYMERAKKNTDLRYLAADGSWTTDYFDPKNAKYRARQVFGGV